MAYIKAYGIVTEQIMPDNAKIKVVSFKRNNEEVFGTSDIKALFPPDGYVFAHSFFGDDQYKIHSLIEFTPSTSVPKKGHLLTIDLKKGWRKVGFPIVVIEGNIFINEHSLDRDILKRNVHEDLSHFYIRNNKFLYGPFKIINKEVVPVIGKEVGKYSLPVDYVQVQDAEYILTDPIHRLQLVDCMSPGQLATWFKTLIQNQNLEVDLGLIKRMLEGQEHHELDRARIERALTELSQIDLTHTELKKLAKLSPALNLIYENSINSIQTKIREEEIESIDSEKKQIEREVRDLKQDIAKLRKEHLDILSKTQSAQSEFNHIKTEKNRLIEDVKVFTNVFERDLPEIKGSLETFEEQLFSSKSTSYVNLNDFEEVFKKNLDQSIKDQWDTNFIFNLKNYKSFLSKEISPIILFAKLSGNSKVFIQQVEPDWIKFEKLYNNGLKQIWESAIKDQNIMHFFVLQDINLASIECYGRPLLDLIKGIRETLPGLNIKWPRNLWIFGIPLFISGKKGFTLPLIKETFEGWGCLPNINFSSSRKEEIESKVLNIKDVFDHTFILGNTSANYFDT